MTTAAAPGSRDSTDSGEDCASRTCVVEQGRHVDDQSPTCIVFSAHIQWLSAEQFNTFQVHWQVALNKLKAKISL